MEKSGEYVFWLFTGAAANLIVFLPWFMFFMLCFFPIMILGIGVSLFITHPIGGCFYLLPLAWTLLVNPCIIFWIFSYSDIKYGSHLLFVAKPMSLVSVDLSCFHLHAHFYHLFLNFNVLISRKKNFKSRVLFCSCFPVLTNNKSSLLLWFNLSVFPNCTMCITQFL